MHIRRFLYYLGIHAGSNKTDLGSTIGGTLGGIAALIIIIIVIVIVILICCRKNGTYNGKDLDDSIQNLLQLVSSLYAPK